MSLHIHLRHLEKKETLALAGEMTPAELGVESLDELVQAKRPLQYDLTAEKLAHSILVQGSLRLTLDCECARCLKPFAHEIQLRGWACDLPLEGEDKAPVVSDAVDLTPYLREDILLAFPQRPLCKADCEGLPNPLRIADNDPGSVPKSKETSGAWAELDKLKLK
jgi:uncharacterized protein